MLDAKGLEPGSDEADEAIHKTTVPGTPESEALEMAAIEQADCDIEALESVSVPGSPEEEIAEQAAVIASGAQPGSEEAEEAIESMHDPGTPEYEAGLAAACAELEQEEVEASAAEDAAVDEASMPGSEANEAAREAVLDIAGAEEGTPEAEIAIE